MLGNLKNISNRLNQMESKDEFNLRMINIADIEPSNKNIYGIRDIEELAKDIKENGLYHNLVVRENESGKYEILSGERRYHALKTLEYEKIPCQVRKNLSDIDFEIMLIQANAKTRELSTSEKLKQVEKLKELYDFKRASGEKIEGKTRDVIGKDLGISGSQVGRYMKISEKLDDSLKDKLNNDEITLRQATKLASLPKEQQEEKYNTMHQEEVKEEKFIADTKELEKAAEPIKEMLTRVSKEISVTNNIDELIQYVNEKSRKFFSSKAIITNRLDNSKGVFRKSIVIGVHESTFSMSSDSMILKFKTQDIEEINIDKANDKAKLVTKGMVIEF